MTVFEQLGRTAKEAGEAGLISLVELERIDTIVRQKFNYKHLGLEIHGLLGELAPAVAQRQQPAAGAVEERVAHIEKRCRPL